MTHQERDKECCKKGSKGRGWGRGAKGTATRSTDINHRAK